MEPMIKSDAQVRVKRAELLSTTGAALLGAGVALLFAHLLQPYALPVLMIGLVAHAWGMLHKHQLESRPPDMRAWWEEPLYWFCWLSMVALLLFILIRTW